jgi:hypothetical protein
MPLLRQAPNRWWQFDLFNMIKIVFFIMVAFTSACNLSEKQVPPINSKNPNLAIMDTASNEITLETKFFAFDTTVEVLFTDTKDSVSELQMKNFDNFVSKQNLLAPEILQKIFEYYKSSYSDYKNGWTSMGQMSDQELEKYLPTPTTAENLKPFITPAIVHIQGKKNCKEGTIGIEFDCTWDIEHGLGVLISDWKVVKASVAEISYL